MFIYGLLCFKKIVIPSTVKEIGYAGICLFDYTNILVTNHICDVIFEEKSELEKVDDYGLSHGNIRIFFCSPVNAVLHHSAYGSGKVSLYSLHSFILNNTLHSQPTQYCYPRIFPDDLVCVSIKRTDQKQIYGFITIILLCF